MQEFAASRARIVAQAEADIEQIRKRMQHDLEAEDVAHSARLHAAVKATLDDLRTEERVMSNGASGGSSEDDGRSPRTTEQQEHGRDPRALSV